MHEFVLAQCLIEDVKIYLKDQENTLLKVVVGFGPFTHATFERVEFWWNTLSAGTCLEGVILVKQDLNGKIFCPNCNEEFTIANRTSQKFDEYLEIFSCPKCNSYQTKILEGSDILLLHLELEIRDEFINEEV